MNAPRRTFTCLCLLWVLSPTGCAPDPLAPIPAAHGEDLRRTPEGVVRLFEAAWNAHDVATLESLFTRDYTLSRRIRDHDEADTSLVSSRVRTIRMPRSAGGTAASAPATGSTHMTLGPYQPGDDDLPRTSDTPWRRTLYRTLRIEARRDGWLAREGRMPMENVVAFALVRGDAAALRPAARAARVAADSSRWWLEGLTVEPAPGTVGSRNHPYAGFVCGNALGDFWWP